MWTHVGIDPGKSGSLAILFPDGSLLVKPTPVEKGEYDVAEMFNILVRLPKNSICILERAQAMPGQGVVSMFEFGRGYGLWQGLLAACGLSYQIVHSRTWTKKMLDGAPGEGKDRAYQVARRLFPSWEPKFKKEHQFADSILLAEYGRRQ